MSQKAVKRIHHDIRNIRRSKLDKNGIFIHINDDNIFNVKALIIGPQDCPYTFGYYLFDIIFPNDYPTNPPSVKYMTLDNAWRANPNLYKCGKVCLSLINTWHGHKQGEGWTSCQTLETVLISIQSMVLGVEHPIQCEPGYEMEVGKKSKDYNKLLNYHNLNVAVLKMILKTPYGFECFKNIMIDKFMENKFHFDKYIDSIKKDHGKSFKSSIYSMYQLFDVELLQKKMQTVYDTHIDYYNEKCEKIMKMVQEKLNQNAESTNKIRSVSNNQNNTNNENNSTNVTNVINVTNVTNSTTVNKNDTSKKKYTRRCPKEMAKKFELGTILDGQCGGKYIVILNKNNNKSWIKVKN